MNEQATGSQQIASAHQKLKTNMSLMEFEQFLDGSVAAPDGERPDDWIALVAPGADEDTRRDLSAALASRAEGVKRQAHPPIAARLAAVRKELEDQGLAGFLVPRDRKSTRLNSSHSQISYAVFCLKKKKTHHHHDRDRNH